MSARNIKVSVLPKYPARIQEGVGIDVTKANGAVTVKLDYTNITGVVDITNQADGQVALYDPSEASWYKTTLGSLKDWITPGIPIDTENYAAYATTSILAGSSVPAAIKYAETSGVNAVGDHGGVTLRRAIKPVPTHPGWVRSVDRYLPDGTVDATNGGWWEYVTNIVTVNQFGAYPGGTPVNNLNGVNNALNYAVWFKLKKVLVYDRIPISENVTQVYDVTFAGPGKLINTTFADWANFREQDNTYAKSTFEYMYRREYMYKAYKVLSYGPGSTTVLGSPVYATLRMAGFGDSTQRGLISGPPDESLITDGGSRDNRFLPQNFYPEMLRKRGISATYDNGGVDGTSWENLDTATVLAGNYDLIELKYAINDVALDELPGDPTADEVTPEEMDAALSDMITAMREKLTELRVAKSYDQLTIVLIGPTSAHVPYSGRTSEWFEQIRQIYIGMADLFHCVYFDAYAYVQDSRNAGHLWMDYPGEVPGVNPGTPLHPLPVMTAWVRGRLIEEMFPESATSIFASNGFSNIDPHVLGYADTTKTLADFSAIFPEPPDAHVSAPMELHHGLTVHECRTADSWPINGYVQTMKGVNSGGIQQVWDYGSYGSPRLRTRTGSNATWTPWAGVPIPLTLQNGWVAYNAATYGLVEARISAEGYVTVNGVIKDGTITDGTVITTLPTYMRPALSVFAVTEGAASFNAITVPFPVVAPVVIPASCWWQINPNGEIITRNGSANATLSLFQFGFWAAG